MIARRDNIRSMRSDNDTNFVGTEKGISRNEPHKNQAFSPGKWSRLAGLDQKPPNCKSYWWGMGAANKISKKHFVIITQNKLE